MCKLVERRRDFKIVGYVKFFSSANVNKELNNDGENIGLLNGKFLTYYIIYYETNEHIKTMEERAIMIKQDYKFVLRQVKVIVEEAKATRLEVSSKKKQIRDGKRKVVDDLSGSLHPLCIVTTCNNGVLNGGIFMHLSIFLPLYL